MRSLPAFIWKRVTMCFWQMTELTGKVMAVTLVLGILDREDCYRWVRFLDERFHGKQKIFLHGISMRR